MKQALRAAAALVLLAAGSGGSGVWAAGTASSADRLPLTDAHIHYSHDAWEGLPPAEAIAVLRRAGLRRAFVSSSGDDGTLKLHALAPDLIVPVLRPYRGRGETGTWFRDPTVVGMLEERLKRGGYAGIGEFHIFGDNADGEIFRKVVALAKTYGVFLHAHSDADAVERIFAQDPEATVLWAHSGFAEPDLIRPMLRRYPRLWADLAFRSDHASGGRPDPDWLSLFEEFPDRFMIGTDTYTPERWYFVEEHADWSREWLGALPPALAERIAWKNADALAAWALDGALGRGCAEDRLGPSATRLADGGAAIAYRTSPERIEVGKPFRIEIVACLDDGSAPARLRVDAGMPAHGHGMNYTPSERSIAPGHSEFDGLVLHMPGDWVLTFDVHDGETRRRVTHKLRLTR